MPGNGSKTTSHQLDPTGCRQGPDSCNPTWSQSTTAQNTSPKANRKPAGKVTFRLPDDNYCEYCSTGAMRQLTTEEEARTRYWVPVFTRQKKDDSNKVRVITDMRDLNQCHGVQRHKPHTHGRQCWTPSKTQTCNGASHWASRATTTISRYTSKPRDG